MKKIKRVPRNYCKCECGRLASDGRRFILGHNRQDIKHSEESKRKMSKSQKGRTFSDEHRRRLSEAIKGRKHSREAVRKISEASRGRKHSEETKIKMSREQLGRKGHFYGRTHTEEAKRRISKAHLGKRNSKETLRKMSISQKAKWKDPEYVKKIMKSFNVRQNKKEKELEKILNNLHPNEWKFVGDGQLIIDGKCPDFTNINGQKKLIELFGDYWHRNDDPEDRIKIFEPFGYKTLVIWEKELRDIKALSEKVLSFYSL